jgi:hypothetical protein
MKMIITAEHTDTFGGQANYSWVRREEFEMKPEATRIAVVREVKKRMGLQCRTITTDFGDHLSLKFVGMAQILFIYWEYKEVENEDCV